MNPNNYCVIMAGGIGSRFWPLSRTPKPKQFLDILGVGKTLLQQTVARFSQICPTENIIIVTNEIYAEIVQEQLPQISQNQILSEPLRRNTAPCIAYANMKIKASNPNALIITAPSDHIILDENEFVRIMKKSLDFVKANDGLLTLGINPTRPETGYGYIQVNNKVSAETDRDIKQIKTFTEKPDRATAMTFIESGEFLWNSGIFIWSLESITKAFNKYQPDIASLFNPQDPSVLTNLEAEKAFIKDAYGECKNISIDHGIMEHADNLYVLAADFGWSDLGTWDALFEISEKNEENNVLSHDNILTYDTRDTIINLSDDKFAVIQGLENYIVAESDNLILICKRDNEKQIRNFINDVKMKRGENYV